MLVAADGKWHGLEPSRHRVAFEVGCKTYIGFGRQANYVEFLNEVADDLTVEGDLVKHKDMIWAYIGDGSAPEDQIVYQNGRFRLRKAEWAARPMVRVTWLGAKAYAHYYGKRLPTFDDWKLLQEQFADTRKVQPASPASPTEGGYSAHLDQIGQRHVTE